MLYLTVLNQRNFLEDKIENIKNKLLNYPDGKLICIKNGKYISHYQLLNKKQIYISQKNSELITKLAEKKYLEASLFDLRKEMNAINSFIKIMDKTPSKIDCLSSNPNYHEILKQIFRPVSKELYEWSRSAYEQKTSYEENLRHTCISGNIVRSKSEVLIDQALFVHKIPYRYECALTLNDGLTIYPDFTIRHPITGEYFYWEHFGMMDNSSYCQNAAQKITSYCKHGIFPSISLLLTYETKDNPLNQITIERIIQEYFIY